MPTAFPLMPSRGLPVRAVKSEPVAGQDLIRDAGPGSVRRLDGPAAAGRRTSIGGKAEEKHLARGDIKNRPVGSWCPAASRPDHDVNTADPAAPGLEIMPLDTGEHVGNGGFGPPSRAARRPPDSSSPGSGIGRT